MAEARAPASVGEAGEIENATQQLSIDKGFDSSSDVSSTDSSSDVSSTDSSSDASSTSSSSDASSSDSSSDASSTSSSSDASSSDSSSDASSTVGSTSSRSHRKHRKRDASWRRELSAESLKELEMKEMEVKLKKLELKLARFRNAPDPNQHQDKIRRLIYKVLKYVAIGGVCVAAIYFIAVNGPAIVEALALVAAKIAGKAAPTAVPAAADAVAQALQNQGLGYGVVQPLLFMLAKMGLWSSRPQ
jgi:hypothetical protein